MIPVHGKFRLKVCKLVGTDPIFVMFSLGTSSSVFDDSKPMLYGS